MRTAIKHHLKCLFIVHIVVSTYTTDVYDRYGDVSRDMLIGVCLCVCVCRIRDDATYCEQK